jgi:hypothetical protein
LVLAAGVRFLRVNIRVGHANEVSKTSIFVVDKMQVILGKDGAEIDSIHGWRKGEDGFLIFAQIQL